MISDDGLATGSPTELFVVIPLSASLRGSRLRPAIKAGADAPVARDSVAVVAAIRGMPRERLLTHIGQLAPAALERVIGALRITLAI